MHRLFHSLCLSYGRLISTAGDLFWRLECFSGRIHWSIMTELLEKQFLCLGWETFVCSWKASSSWCSLDSESFHALFSLVTAVFQMNFKALVKGLSIKYALLFLTPGPNQIQHNAVKHNKMGLCHVNWVYVLNSCKSDVKSDRVLSVAQQQTAPPHRDLIS